VTASNKRLHALLREGRHRGAVFHSVMRGAGRIVAKVHAYPQLLFKEGYMAQVCNVSVGLV